MSSSAIRHQTPTEVKNLLNHWNNFSKVQDEGNALLASLSIPQQMQAEKIKNFIFLRSKVEEYFPKLLNAKSQQASFTASFKAISETDSREFPKDVLLKQCYKNTFHESVVSSTPGPSIRIYTYVQATLPDLDWGSSELTKLEKKLATAHDALYRQDVLGCFLQNTDAIEAALADLDGGIGYLKQYLHNSKKTEFLKTINSILQETKISECAKELLFIISIFVGAIQSSLPRDMTVKDVKKNREQLTKDLTALIGSCQDDLNIVDLFMALTGALHRFPDKDPKIVLEHLGSACRILLAHKP